jgi:hypothetical protein
VRPLQTAFPLMRTQVGRGRDRDWRGRRELTPARRSWRCHPVDARDRLRASGGGKANCCGVAPLWMRRPALSARTLQCSGPHYQTPMLVVTGSASDAVQRFLRDFSRGCSCQFAPRRMVPAVAKQHPLFWRGDQNEMRHQSLAWLAAWLCSATI